MSDTEMPKQYEYDSFDGYVDALEEFARVASKGRNDALQLARGLRDALDVSLIRAYTSGYRHGHEATVEAQYFDIHWTDESSYFKDDIRQMIFDGALPEAQAAITKANQLLK